MAALTHFKKYSASAQATANVALEEVAAYTITFENLTAVGFAAGDDVMMLMCVNHGGANAASTYEFEIGTGATFAGRAAIVNEITEPNATAATRGTQVLWLRRRTLVDGDDFYFSHRYIAGGAGATNSQLNDFSVIVLKLSELTANDFVFAEATHSGNAPDTFDTSGAGITIPQNGNYLLVATSEWLSDTAGGDNIYHAINVAGTDQMQVDRETEDVDEEMLLGSFMYAAGLVTNDVCRVRYRTQDGVSSDCERTAIFALRLGAFKDSAGVFDQSTITHSVVRTFSEFAGVPTYGASQTGDVAVFAMSVYDVIGGTGSPHVHYGRVQLGGADWPAASMFRVSCNQYQVNDKAPFTAMAIESVTAGTLDWDFDCAEDIDIDPTPTDSNHMAVVFSLELAGAAAGHPAMRRHGGVEHGARVGPGIY